MKINAILLAVLAIFKQIFIAFIATGQTMRWFGALGALVMALAFIGALVQIIYVDGLYVFVERGEIIITLLVVFVVAMLLCLVWGWVRLLLGKEPLESSFDLRSQFQGRATIYFASVMGILFLIFLPMLFIHWVSQL